MMISFWLKRSSEFMFLIEYIYCRRTFLAWLQTGDQNTKHLHWYNQQHLSPPVERSKSDWAEKKKKKRCCVDFFLLPSWQWSTWAMSFEKGETKSKMDDNSSSPHTHSYYELTSVDPLPLSSLTSPLTGVKWGLPKGFYDREREEMLLCEWHPTMQRFSNVLQWKDT